MSTTLVPPETPAAAPPPAPRVGLRYPTVFANLLPDEVIAARRTRQLQQRILVGLGVLLVVLVGWYGMSVLQTSSAKGDLSAAKRAGIELQNKQRQYAPLVTAQQQSVAIRAKLSQLMAGDLQWSDLLSVLRSSAPQGVQITAVNGTLSIGQQAANAQKGGGGLSVLNASGKQSVGSLTVTGSASDKNVIAAYVDDLGKIPGLAAPFPASVTDGAAGLTFTANVILTTDILGGRYSTQAPQGGH